MEPRQVAISGVVCSWLIVGLAMLRGRRVSHRAHVRSRRFAGLVGIVLQGAGFAIAFGFPGSSVPSSTASTLLQWLAALLAIVLALASAALFVASVRRLGKQWSLVPRVVGDHDLIDDGPYAIVRHPIYTAMLGLLVATALSITTIGWTAVAVALYAPGTIVRIRIEERLLYSTFGDRYTAYARRVPALLPFVRRSPH